MTDDTGNPEYEAQKWMEMMDDHPTLGFLIQRGLLEIDLDVLDPVTGTSTFLLTAKGWEIAFQLLLYQIYKKEHPELELSPLELVAAGRDNAFVLLYASMKTLADPEEADDEEE